MKAVNKADASVHELSTPSTTSKFDDQTLNEVNKADGEKLVMIHIYLEVLYFFKVVINIKFGLILEEVVCKSCNTSV